jgi:hypothetical protein
LFDEIINYIVEPDNVTGLLKYTIDVFMAHILDRLATVELAYVSVPSAAGGLIPNF